MTMKLLVVSTAPNTDQILEVMQTQAGDDLDVVLHFGAKTAHYKASSLSRMKATTGTRGHLLDDRPYSGAARAVFDADQFYAARDLFLEHLHRTSEPYKYKSHPLSSHHDLHDYHAVLADAIADAITASGATHCLFFNVPHLAYDTLIYQVAQGLGLPITIVTQSLFPGRFFSMKSPLDYGAFTPGAGASPHKIEKGAKPDLFYMKGIKQQREAGGRITAKAVLQLMTFLITKRPLKALNPVYLVKTLRHMQRVYGAFPKWRDPFARFFHEDAFAYFDHLADYEDQELDLSGDFVYFPLQLQPEMTTSSLGGMFRDQAYAIERLSEILPDGVRILVKENPKQGAYMRGPLFFHRLRRIKNVTFLPSWADTHALTDGARFVAAITGTVGWEAICSGKPAVVFGKAWYRKLPGVHEFSDDLTYADILREPIDHAALETAAGALLARAHDGVVDRHYTRMVKDFNETANADQAAASILALLRGEATHSFSS